MADWNAYARRNLKLKNVLPEQQREAVDDVARQLEDAYNDAIARGLTAVDAERETAHITDWDVFVAQIERSARYQSSAVERFAREAPGSGKPLVVESFLQDIRYTLRAFVKKPAFFTLVVVTLALGIGANTAIFSIVNTVLLKPLPYKNPDRLVQIFERRPRQNRYRGAVSPADFIDWREQNQVFETLAAFLPTSVNLTEVERPESLSAAAVSTGFLEMLGVQPAQGRTFTAKEEEPGFNRVVMLSEGFWKRRFNADPSLIGKPIAAIRTMDQVLELATVSTRFTTFLLGGFAGLALLLATVGLYGVMGFFVSQRFNEIGIRIALGASRGAVIQMILRQGLGLTCVGLAIGVASAFALTRYLSTILFNVNEKDPVTLIGVSLLLAATAVLACYVPARRASRIDPINAVRSPE